MTDYRIDWSQSSVTLDGEATVVTVPVAGSPSNRWGEIFEAELRASESRPQGQGWKSVSYANGVITVQNVELAPPDAHRLRDYLSAVVSSANQKYAAHLVEAEKAEHARAVRAAAAEALRAEFRSFAQDGGDAGTDQRQ
jgi:hypothetical protein